MSEKRVVVIGFDGSEYAEYTMKWYLENVCQPIDFCVVVYCPELHDIELANPKTTDKIIAEAAGKVAAMEQRCKELLAKVKLGGRFRTGPGKPGEYICKVANEEGASFIITGSRGMGTIRRTMLGSVSDYIVHHSHIPVLVCRHPKHHEHHHQEQKKTN